MPRRGDPKGRAFPSVPAFRLSRLFRDIIKETSVKGKYFPMANGNVCKKKFLYGTTCSHLSFRCELLALCRGLEVMLLLPVTLLVLVTMGEPVVWARLWIIVWASSASSTTSLMSCSCWSLVFLLGAVAAAAAEEKDDCTVPPTAHAGDVGQYNVFQNCKTGLDLMLNYRTTFVYLVYGIYIQHICNQWMNLFRFPYPIQLQSLEEKELRMGRLTMDMILVWHLVCSLEPPQMGTLPPEQRLRETDEKRKSHMRTPEIVWLLTKEMFSSYVIFSVDGWKNNIT